MQKWSEDVTLMFVQEYLRHECLWNFKSPDYKNKESKEKATCILAESMCIPGFGKNEAILKIKQMRTNYRGKLRRLRMSSKSESSAGETRKSKMEWFDILDRALKSAKTPQTSPTQEDVNVRKMDIKRNLDKDKDSSLNSPGYGEEKRLHSYLETLSGQPEVLNVVEMDHTYSLPWNYRPDNCYAKPAKKLFWNRLSQSVSWGSEEAIDVVETGKDNVPAYDLNKAQQMMDETSRLVPMLRPHPGDSDWETKIDRSDWSMSQSRILDRVLRILHLEQLARASYKGNWNEPALRRIALDKSARRFRNIMSTILWKPKIIHWLHLVLLENLELNYLISYIDILQTLNKKIGRLIERLVSGPTSNKVNHDVLNMLLKKPWDPASTGLTCSKPSRLPGNPLFVIVPYGSNGGSESSRRIQRWLPYLAPIANVLPVNTNTSNRITVVTSLEHMMCATRAKLAELRSDYIGRPIILLGLNSGSALACQVALLEQVSAVICLGFPVNTVEDKRGQPDDNLLSLSTPVLFVIGQHAATSYVDDVEEIREKLRVETGLVIVGGADDHLRISKSKQRMDGITQAMVDRCIIDEVTDFVGHILSSPQQTSSSQSNENRSRFKTLDTKKRKIAIQDEIYPRKQYVPTSRRGIGGRGRGRARYVTQPTNGTIGITRRGGMLEKGITRPSIENISVINTSSLDHSALSGEATSFKILPQFKVLGSEDFPASKIDGTDSSFVDQLTPDRLLEMPVIIASDNQEEHSDSGQLKVMMPSSSEGLDDGGEAKSDMKCATIFVRKRGGHQHRGAARKPTISHYSISTHQ